MGQHGAIPRSSSCSVSLVIHYDAQSCLNPQITSSDLARIVCIYIYEILSGSAYPNPDKISMCSKT